MRMFLGSLLFFAGCTQAPATVDQMVDSTRQDIERIYSETPDLLTSRLMFLRQWGTDYSLDGIRSIASQCSPSDFAFDQDNSLVAVGQETNRIFFVCRQQNHLVVFQKYIVVGANFSGEYLGLLVCPVDDCESYPEKHFAIG